MIMSPKSLLAGFAVLLMVAVASATYGVDVSSLVSVSSFECLKSNGYDFAVVRAWKSLGVFDDNAPATVANAWAAGIAHVDVYMFPDTSIAAAGQVSSLHNSLVAHGVKLGMLWLDIEVLAWPSSCSGNQAFIKALIDEAEALGYNVGIYTNAYNWGTIACNWTGASSRPLWYAHYDANPSFSDFKAFGGWSTPAIKQYAGSTGICSATVDKNWY